MRQLALLTLASFAAVGIAACGTGPDGTETTESAAQDLFMTCPPGEQPECSWDAGRKTCQCVESMPPPPPPTCNWVKPPPGTWSYVQSWSVASPTGACPPIPGPNGTWENLQPLSVGPREFDGVPCEVSLEGADPATCQSIPELAGQPCCTYVWWPTGFQTPPPGVPQYTDQFGEPPQPACTEDAVPSVLCQRSGETFYAIVSGVNCATTPDAGACGHGGGGSSCSSCWE